MVINGMPSSLVIGESLNWVDKATVDESDNVVASDVWTLTYNFRGVGKVDVTATAQGLDWVTAILTSTFTTPGLYYYQATLTKSGAKRRLHGGQFTLNADLSAVSASTYDGRSQARKDLDAVQLAMRTLASDGVKSYTIGARSMTKRDLPELIVMESKLKVQVVSEERADRIAEGLGDPNRVVLRFK